jgi:methyl-accepting chemotaxis protein
MKVSFHKSINSKMLGLILLVALLPTIVIGYLSFYSASESLTKTELEAMNAARDLRKNEIRRYMIRAMRDTRFLAESPFSSGVINRLETISLQESMENQAAEVTDKSSWLLKSVSAELDEVFTKFFSVFSGDFYGYDDVMLVSLNTGNIFYSFRKRDDLGTNIKTGHLKDTGLAKAFNRAVQTKNKATEDFSLYGPSGKPTAFMAVTVPSNDPASQAVIILSFDLSRISMIMAVTEGMARSSDRFLVGQDFLLRSTSRPENYAGILRTRVDTEAVRKALENSSGSGVFKNTRGDEVLASYGEVGIKEIADLGADFDWGIVAEVGVHDALADVTKLKQKILWIEVLIAIAAIIVAFISARKISRPVMVLSELATQVSEGNLSVETPTIVRRDEIGSLAASIISMIGGLKQQITEILAGANVVAVSSSEISATVSQLAATASETSAAVTETTTTLEELRQTAQVSNEKAKAVAEGAKRSISIAETGRKATAEMIAGMNSIKNQMESIGESVVRLSEQSQSIEQIISSVHDLAEQSNLLAVNASIEAARAGEQGKGFAVVAEEIKSLAEQSKQATNQVRNILEDIRNSISSVVMATEQGNRAVDSGVGQSTEAGRSIQEIAKSVQGAAQALTVVAASSEQQTIGVDQVASAMANIEKALQQNVDGTRHLEVEVRNLEQLGSKLKESVSRYKV